MIDIGRIRTDDIKKTSFELMKQHPDKFSTDFEKNKASLNELNMITEKKLRNRIAGYITRVAKTQTKEDKIEEKC